MTGRRLDAGESGGGFALGDSGRRLDAGESGGGFALGDSGRRLDAGECGGGSALGDSGRRLDALETEGRSAALADLDRRPTLDIVRAVVRGHEDVLAAVQAAEPAIAALADAAAARLAAGGRVVYVGAGSAGWLAFVDAMELGPTFSVPAGTIVALVAGAEHPVGSLEEAAAEDDAGAGAAAVRALAPRPEDVVVAVSASGRTPFAVGALDAAAEAGALTAAVVCATGAELARRAELVVEAPVGAEVISGSTRLKAGTAQKLILNAFSTALMVRRGRTLGDLMTSMRVANGKLRVRAVRICVAATGCDEPAARAALAAAEDDVALAVVMIARGLDPVAARAALDAAGGALRAALEG